MEEYKIEMLDGIRLFASDNKAKVKELLEDEDDVIDFITDESCSDYITGNASGSFYCDEAKAKNHVYSSHILDDESFLECLIESGTHLEELILKGWETVDVWARCYILDSVLSENEIKQALAEGAEFEEE